MFFSFDELKEILTGAYFVQFLSRNIILQVPLPLPPLQRVDGRADRWLLPPPLLEGCMWWATPLSPLHPQIWIAPAVCMFWLNLGSVCFFYECPFCTTETGASIPFGWLNWSNLCVFILYVCFRWTLSKTTGSHPFCMSVTSIYEYVSLFVRSHECQSS